MRHATAILCLLTLISCRDEQLPPHAGTPSYGTPVVMIPDGILRSPRGITIDRSGDVWVADTYNDRVAVFTPQGSQRFSLPLSPLPGPMGIDRGTGDLLVVTGGTTLYRITPASQQVSAILTLTPPAIASGAVYDVTTGTFRARTLASIQAGDPDGAPNGEIFLSCLANTRENYLVRIQSGSATAVAYSSYTPVDSLNRFPRYVGAAVTGSVHTAFVMPDNSLFGLVTPYIFPPGNPALGRPFRGGEDAGSVFVAAGMNDDGLIAVADVEMGTVILFTLSPEGPLAVFTLPAVSGLSRPAATDVAVASGGSLFVAIRDLDDAANQRGAVLRYPRSQ